MSNAAYRTKLLAFGLTVSSIPLLVIVTISVIYDSVSSRRMLTAEIETRAAILGINCASALAFDDAAYAKAILSGLKAADDVVAAAVYDPDGALFASFVGDRARSQIPERLRPPGVYRTWREVTVFRGMTLQGRAVGTLCLKADFSRLDARIWQYVRIASVFLLLSIGLSAFLAGGLSRSLVRPITALESTAGRVAQAHDYSLRAEVHSDDEVGRLARAFNLMLARIGSADREREKLVTELEDKNAEMERFVYTVSHDLRGPLITIKGFCGRLGQHMSQGSAERANHDLERIRNAADRMQELLDDLLELSRIGRMANPPAAVPMTRLSEEVVELLEGPIRRRNVRVTVARNMPVVHADRVRIAELLQNLVENAVKFSGEDPEPRIDIGFRNEGGSPVFTVADAGIGIDPAYHEKVFGLFDQLDRKAEGTGVGLALARRIVEAHGGRIWVESEGQGRGSTFCFTLPVIADAGPSGGGDGAKPGGSDPHDTPRDRSERGE